MSGRDLAGGPAPVRQPVIEIVLDEQGRGSVDGAPVDADPQDPQGTLLAEATRRAARLGRPLRVRAQDPAGTWHLIAHPDGAVTEAEPTQADAAGEPAAWDDPGSAWHLRVHPSGLITPVEPLPAAPPPLATERPKVENLVDDLRAAGDPGERAPRRSGRWREWRVWQLPRRPAAVAGVVVVLLGAATLVARQAGADRARSATSSATAGGASRSAAAQPRPGPSSAGNAGAGSTAGGSADPGLLTPVAVGPPPGYSATPVWAVPVSGSATSVVSADNRILTVTQDGQVALIDPGTGAVRWQAPAPAQATGPHLAQIDGHAVVAMVAVDRLSYWVLPPNAAIPPSASAPSTAAVQVDLPSGTSVSWAGPSPLLRLPDGTVAVVSNAALQRVVLPTGARALAADGSDVLAVSGRNWLRQSAGSPPGVPKELSLPDGATGPGPVRVENVGGGFLAAAWAGASGPIVGVYDAHTGDRLIDAVFPREVDFAQAPTVREPGSDRTLVGPALIEPQRHNLTLLGSSYTPLALTPGHVFAHQAGDSVVDLRIDGKNLRVVPFTSKNPTVPVGITAVNGRSLAVIVAPAGSGWRLCALPAE